MEFSSEREKYNILKPIALLSSFALVATFGSTTVKGEYSRETCGDAIEQIAPYHYEEVIPEMSSKDMRSESILAEHLAEIEELYGVEIAFKIKKQDSDTNIKNAITLNGVVDALQEVSPALTNELDLSSITITDSIETADHKDASGLYIAGPNEIIVEHSSYDSARQIAIHEFAHAIDYQLLCPPHDVAVDVTFAQHSQTSSDLLPAHLSPTPDRMFANEYGSTNIREDRATQFEYLFYDRGLVREHDPDYASPFHKKQAELLRRLEMLLPGVTEHLDHKTTLLRADSNELKSNIENPFKKGEFSPALSILSNAFLNKIPVEQLRDTVVTISYPGQEAITIQNPVVMRDSDEIITAIAWTPAKDSVFLVDTAYNDSEFISFQRTPQTTRHFGYIDSTASGGPGFLRGGISIDGVQAIEIPQE